MHKISGKPVRGNEKSQSYPLLLKTTQTHFRNNRISKQLKLAPNVIKIKNDNRPYVMVKVGNKELTALLDSGANVSILGRDSEDIIEEFNLIISFDNSIIKTADGKSHKVNGSIDIPITYNDVTKVVKCLIVPTLENKLLFGVYIIYYSTSYCGLTEITERKIDSAEHQLTDEQKGKLREALLLIPEIKEKN